MSKYTIAIATEEDIEDILDMLKAFHKEGPYRDMEWCVDSASSYLFNVLDNGLLIIAKDMDGFPVGTMGFDYGSMPFNANHYIYLEKFYYACEYARHSNLGTLLMDFAEKEIQRKEDAQHIIMATLSTTPAHVGQYYTQRGYSHVESGYMKEIK